MITFDGRLTRTEYWKNLVLGLVFLCGYSFVSLSVLSALDAADETAAPIIQVLAIVIFAVYCSGLVMWLTWVYSLIVRRARDAGNVIAWGVTAVLTPLGFLTVGLPPSKPKNK